MSETTISRTPTRDENRRRIADRLLTSLEDLVRRHRALALHGNQAGRTSTCTPSSSPPRWRTSWRWRAAPCTGTRTWADSETRVDRLALQCEHGEHALVHPPQRFAAGESLQRLDAQGVLAQRERALRAEVAVRSRSRWEV